jgi:hypothetical protein
MRTLVPTGLFKKQVQDVADRPELNAPLAALYWALRNKADDYPLAGAPFGRLRLAKTDSIRGIPRLFALFRIVDNTVELVYLEVEQRTGFVGPAVL